MMVFDETNPSAIPPPANNIYKYWTDNSYMETLENEVFLLTPPKNEVEL